MASAEVQRELISGGRGHHRRSHFLVVAYAFHGHLNTARALARRLARVHAGSVDVTLSVKESGDGSRVFPSADGEASDSAGGTVSYAPHSDSFELGRTPRNADESARSRRECVESLSAVVRRLAAAGCPVTCIVSVFSLPAADVAVALGIPLAVYWIQPVTALAAYYHYFHGYEQLFAAHAGDPSYQVTLPGMPPLRIRDFPSSLVDATGGEQARNNIEWQRALHEHIGRERPKVLANTIDVLEAAALGAMRRYLDVFAVGPMFPRCRRRQTSTAAAAADDDEDRIELYKQGNRSYMEWLDAWPARSVVYVSFGSILTHTRRQAEEILHGLRRCGRPFLLVSRKDGPQEDDAGEVVPPANGGGDQDGQQGVVVEWCDQPAVLAHPSVGCFVTHGGWNSAMESIASGVPMITVPSRSDQALIAHLVEDQWGAGLRAERDGGGVLAGAELARCVELLMDDGDRAIEIGVKVKALKEKLQASVIQAGVIESRLESFVETMHTNPK